MDLPNEENYLKRIHSITTDQWASLVDLIPLLEASQEAKVISMFSRIVYEIPIIISFDWMRWEEGRRILEEKSFDHLDVPTLCKVITTIVRRDRFCEGSLESAFDSGLILKLLRSIKNQVGQID